MSAKFERRIPVVIAIVAAIVAAAIAYIYDIDPPPKPLAAGTMTFGIVVAGFAATQRNMLLGMVGSKVLRFAVRTGFHHDVLAYLMHCVYAGLAVAVASVIGFFLDDETTFGPFSLWEVWLVILVGLIVWVIVLMFRNELMMRRIVERFVEEQPNNTQPNSK